MVLIETARYVSIKRNSKLGELGERLAEEWLTSLGCSCTRTPRNYPFADMIGAWKGKKYFIGVKARNEMQMGGHDYNESYNIVKISDAKRRVLEEQGKTEDYITRMLWEEVGLGGET
jgi:Holliday junction resolvase-like predicted endonuclease